MYCGMWLNKRYRYTRYGGITTNEYCVWLNDVIIIHGHRRGKVYLTNFNKNNVFKTFSRLAFFFRCQFQYFRAGFVIRLRITIPRHVRQCRNYISWECTYIVVKKINVIYKWTTADTFPPDRVIFIFKCFFATGFWVRTLRREIIWFKISLKIVLLKIVLRVWNRNTLDFTSR